MLRRWRRRRMRRALRSGMTRLAAAQGRPLDEETLRHIDAYSRLLAR